MNWYSMGMLGIFFSLLTFALSTMNNPVIQTDIAEVLNKLDQRFDKLDNRFDKFGDRLDKIDERLTKLEVGQTELNGKIATLEAKLSGQIKTLDEKISGQKEVAEKTTAQLDKRISNQELLNRVIGGSLVISIIGGIVSFFWMVSKMS